MRPARSRRVLLRQLPPLLAGLALLAPGTAFAESQSDPRPDPPPAARTVAPDPYPSTPTPAPAPAAPRVPPQVVMATVRPAARRVPPAAPTHRPARLHRRRTTPPARVVDVFPLRVDVAAGLGELPRAGERSLVPAALALLVAALAAAAGGGVVLATKELR